MVILRQECVHKIQSICFKKTFYYFYLLSPEDCSFINRGIDFMVMSTSRKKWTGSIFLYLYQFTIFQFFSVQNNWNPAVLIKIIAQVRSCFKDGYIVNFGVKGCFIYIYIYIYIYIISQPFTCLTTCACTHTFTLTT